MTLYPYRGQVRESELPVYENGKQRGKTQDIFSDENGSPFITGTDKPKLMQTSVFVDRVFNRLPYNAIAEKYGVTVKTVQNEYKNAKRRLFVIMNRLDSEECAGQVVKSAEGRMTKQVKAFLLYELFGLTVTQVARLMKITKATVLVHILRVRDLIITNELQLLPTTDDEVGAARFRLEKVRRTQRERLREKAAGGRVIVDKN